MPSQPSNRITGLEYTAFDSAYHWFNEKLFGGCLPPCLITLQRKSRSYHNREWAEHMISIGLMPSDTGEPGGKQTGQGMSHYIIDGGPFDRAGEALLATGFCLNWQSAALVGQQGKTAKERSKTKYTCPSCGQNAWAKPEAALVCGECMEPMEAHE